MQADAPTRRQGMQAERMTAPVLVTGATGYVGGRLVPLLLEKGYRVRAMVRSARKLGCRPWAAHPNLEITEADLHDTQSLRNALSGCGAVYYLVHSMTARHNDFKQADRTAAYNMVRALKNSGVQRVIYLSGLLPDAPDISPHLRSRAEVAEILSLSDTPVTVLRAAQILGSGSASFELVRYLADRLPVMITPRWVRTECQPIAISNVLEYLEGVLRVPETEGKTYDIGGPDILTYKDLFDIYAQEAGLRKRLIIPVPVLTPYVSSLWLNLVTPVPTVLARPLVEGLRNRVVCSENTIRQLIPQELTGVRQAVRLALDRLRQHTVPTCWSDAGSPPVPEWIACGDASFAGGTVLHSAHMVRIHAEPDEVWTHIRRIGGETGWYQGDALWRLRGFVDKLLGGPGLRRGRRHPEELFVGDALDFWRVLDIREEKRLLLLAEMRLPGEALLEFTLTPAGQDDAPGAGGQTGLAGQAGQAPQTELVMTARFLPRGLWGIVYWYAMHPFHQGIFSGMLRAIARKTGKDITAGPVRLKGSRSRFDGSGGGAGSSGAGGCAL